jgi:uncharacterized glyoxalase superfamily protein PhnB
MAAIGFYAAAFGAIQKALMPSIDGLRIMHCELSINGGVLYLSDAFPEFGKARSPLPGEPVTASVSLEFGTSSQVDETFKRAVSLGATGEMHPTNSFWGTRFAIVRDPFGHRWMMNGPLSSATKPKAGAPNDAPKPRPGDKPPGPK